MAFASVGTLGSALSSGNNQSSLTLTTSATVEAGNLITVIIATDNDQTTDGASTAVSGVTAGGIAMTKAIEYTNGQGTVQTGATVGVWYLVAPSQINSSSSIIASFTSSTLVDASAMSAWEWTVAAGAKVAVEATNTLANDGAAAGSLDAATANIECLRIRAIASESNSSTALTKTAAFTAVLTQAISGAGTSATEIGIRGEYLISTGTGQSSAPTGGAGAVDHASAYVAFKELPLQTLTPSLYTDTDSFHTPTVSHVLTASLYTDADTYYTHTITTGVVGLTASLYSDADTFNAHTLSSTYELTASLVTDGDTFFTHVVTQPATNQNLLPGLFTNAQKFPPDDQSIDWFWGGAVEHQVANTLVVDLFSNSNTFYSHTLATTYALTASLFTNSNTFFTQTLSSTYTLSPSLYSDDDTFYTQTVSASGSALLPDLFSDGDTFYTPAVTRGVVNLSASLFTDNDTFYSVTTLNVNALSPSLYTDADTFNTHTVVTSSSILPSIYTDTDTFHNATVVSTYVITPSLYVDTDTFLTHTISAATVIVPSLYLNSNTFYTQTLTGGGESASNGGSEIIKRRRRRM